jgi:hypothetical protein
MLLASRIEHRDLLWNQQRGKRDILRNDEVSWLGLQRNVLVGHIRPAIDPHRGDKLVPRRRLQPQVGHQDGLDPKTLRRAKDQLLDVPRGGVGIYPDLQIYPDLRLGRPLRLEALCEVAGLRAQ